MFSFMFDDYGMKMRYVIPLVILGALILVIFIYAVLVKAIPIVVDPDQCSSNTYECRKHQVELCLKDEQYTLEQCIQLMGGK